MSSNSATQVEEWLTVGRLDASLALLTTKNHHVIEFPTMLLPDNIRAGTIVKIQVSEDRELQQQEFQRFESLQDEILEKYGTHRPQNPVLKSINVTQTSGVLGWDPLELGSAQLKSLVLYKDGVRSLLIPNPYKTTATKISGLSVDSEYSFQLKLSTTSGDLWSDKIVLHTHKMTDMSGITACLGSLDAVQNVTKAHIEASLKNIGAKPLQSRVTLDTTHFISNEQDGDDAELKKAQQSNIPIVRPEWVRACELERRIVGVRGFYLDADPINTEGYKFLKVPSDVSEHLQAEKPTVSAHSRDSEPPQTAVSADSAAVSTASLKSVPGGIAATPIQSQETGGLQEAATSTSEKKPSEEGAEDIEEDKAGDTVRSDQEGETFKSEKASKNSDEKGAESNGLEEKINGHNVDENNEEATVKSQDQIRDELVSEVKDEDARIEKNDEIKIENGGETKKENEDRTVNPTDDQADTEANREFNGESETEFSSQLPAEPASQIIDNSAEINTGVKPDINIDNSIQEDLPESLEATEQTQLPEENELQNKTTTEAEAPLEPAAVEDNVVTETSDLVENPAFVEISTDNDEKLTDGITGKVEPVTNESISVAPLTGVNSSSMPNESAESSAELDQNTGGEDAEAENTHNVASSAATGAQATGKKKKNKKNKNKGKK
ncbi:Chs5p LALA0_S10e03290g [Lachancea lanzarotensis]|uniref:Chitin biosynthesis protein CHS5 n=1 Tax=Lachancea lanzarotensis TaxID=1245769 RepID=A0A0C7NCP4_9SACH|nr:uncharacterized protein LALA0_S10e03290g [Lachancea lanzarotensis]CEP64137.1 LALA0S10e03290g1_1 [Lachancea lanzarotensis]